MKTFQELEIHGQSEDLDKFLNDLSSRLIGWQRDPETEKRLNRTDDTKYVAIHTPLSGSLPSATLYLLCTGLGKATVANVVPSQTGALTKEQYNKVVQDFYDTYVLGHLEPYHLTATLSKDEISVDDLLSQQSANILKSFSSSANMSTGSSHPTDQKRWFDFICSVFRNHEDIGPETLRGVLVDQGWPEDEAYELASEYEVATALLERYAETAV